MHQRHVSGGQGDRHAGRHQGALERLERHVLGGDQVGARVPGVGVPKLDRMAGIKRFDQDLGVFGLVICLVERHQAAHSSHTGWPSSVTYASWLRCHGGVLVAQIGTGQFVILGDGVLVVVHIG